MNPSTALARVLVDELARGGVTDAVLSPGSRSAPLAFALHDADRAGRLRLHVRIDERSAAFLALGLAKASGRPVPVVTTSGTAAANLHPAVLEASHAHVPLLVFTADRPPELRGTGANQTIDQIKLYGDAVRLFVEAGTPTASDPSYWRALTCRALSVALGDLGTAPGPVHLNLALREPLVPDGEGDLGGRPDGAPWTTRVAAVAPVAPDDLPPRTVVVLGDCSAAEATAALHLAEERCWPVVAEPSASASGPTVVDAAELVAASEAWVDRHRPDRVLVIGRPTLSRAVGRLVASAPVDVVATAGGWSDPHRRASRILAGIPLPAGDVEQGWLEMWIAAGVAARTVVEDMVVDLSEPAVAIEVMAAASSLLVVGSSKPVRDLFIAPSRAGVRVLANRGVAGIDGMVSTAVGAALAHGRQTFALLGDLTFLHDSNGLVLGPVEPRPDLTLVVVNNDGGAIFGLLEQGAPEHAEAFERVFGTPHGVDLAALCRATATPYTLVDNREALRRALKDCGGLQVVEVRTDRREAVTLDRQLRVAAAAALTPDHLS